MPSLVRSIVVGVFIVAVNVVAVNVQPVAAQSFFEKLFGGFGGSTRLQEPPPMPSYRAPIRVPQSRFYEDGRETSSHGSSRTLRTVCVRMCDGYYFPINDRSNQRRLTADSARCKASCGNEARLFYSSDGGDDPGAMVDLTGRRYDSLDIAFDYRKKLTPGCACKLAPWSSTERLKHANYALEEADQRAKVLQAEAALAERDGGVAAASNGTTHVSALDRQDVASAAGADVETVQEMTPTAAGAGGAEQPDLGMGDVHARRGEPSSSASISARNGARRVRPTRRAARRDAMAASSPKLSGGGFLGLGKSNYVWPGDRR